MATLAFAVAAYLIGSLSFAVIVSRMFGLPDPHSYGSGNPGATNVLRTGRKLAAALTLAGDTGKGALAVVLARIFAADYGVDTRGIALVALAVFLGHVFPLFFRFKGGKGVATAFGAVCALAWPVALAMLATWLAMVAVFRYSSLSALTAAVLAPIYMALLVPIPPYIVCVIVMALFLIWRHRANIRRLLAGTEDRIGSRSKGEAAR